ncbi:type-1 angiotensin II receptor B-like [Hyalella azteca]|uniref:Type-1 angiotensin II receptor B-like n=1 Tax=Hyalella azteca TaxID=294128 RepID=A0A8B7NMW0_HYAAZ|nr:type-1 angiotensin II receptor B-like [Hyalella azteca]
MKYKSIDKCEDSGLLSREAPSEPVTSSGLSSASTGDGCARSHSGVRTASSYVFIINLAISDLVLCLATTPLTLLEIVPQYWPLGDTPFLCKLVGTLQATSIFVSTISITANALDRYYVILHPTRRALGTSGALFTLPGIWACALLLAMPQFLFRTLQHHDIGLPGLDACSNPVLYGWLNDNFRKEFNELWLILMPCRHRSMSAKSKVFSNKKEEKLGKPTSESKDHPEICLIVKRDENFADLSHCCSGYEIIAQPLHSPRPRVVDFIESNRPFEISNGLMDLSLYVKCTSV